MNILRIAASMAWADGNFAPQQFDVILSRLSQEFATNTEHQSSLQKELQNYLPKNIPLEELVPKLKNFGEKERALKLSYEVIRCNEINNQEIAVYQKLLRLLDLPNEIIEQVETEIEAKYK